MENFTNAKELSEILNNKNLGKLLNENMDKTWEKAKELGISVFIGKDKLVTKIRGAVESETCSDTTEKYTFVFDDFYNPHPEFKKLKMECTPDEDMLPLFKLIDENNIELENYRFDVSKDGDSAVKHSNGVVFQL